jgi:hypothetical protein
MQAKYNIVQELLGRFHGLPGTGATLGDQEKALLLELRTERARSRLAMKALFNPYFGSTFLTDTGKESAFAYNVQRYADVYTSRLENFLQYSTDAWLFTPYDVKILPHHIKVGLPLPDIPVLFLIPLLSVLSRKLILSFAVLVYNC